MSDAYNWYAPDASMHQRDNTCPFEVRVQVASCDSGFDGRLFTSKLPCRLVSRHMYARPLKISMKSGPPLQKGKYGMLIMH